MFYSYLLALACIKYLNKKHMSSDKKNMITKELATDVLMGTLLAMIVILLALAL
jgi:hypothetical protein